MKRELALFLAVAPSLAFAAAPSLRVQTDQRGDFVLIGNTLAQECRVTAGSPVIGTIQSCGTDITDGSPDVYWTSDGGTATADVSVQPLQARTYATLSLPAGAQVTHARLYWASTLAFTANPALLADTDAALHLPNGQTQQVQADASWVETASSTFYQSTADVTSWVQANGAGLYGVSGVDGVALANKQTEVPYAAWSLVVFYALSTEPHRNLTLFDGYTVVDTQTGSPPVTLAGFKVPNAGFSARLGVTAFDGDVTLSGDSLLFNGNAVSDAANPVGNFFNSSHSRLGAVQSPAGNRPWLTGLPGSMGGFDLDEVDVTSQVAPGDTQATVSFTTSGDGYVLGTFVVSISTLKPDFTSSTKSVMALAPRPSGAVRPGDELEYTITVSNTGTDEAIGVTLEDPLPTGLTFVPGSLHVSDPAGTGSLTDATGDDRGEYDAASQTVRVRIGAGASSTVGGALPVGAAATITFRARVAAGAGASVANVAEVTSACKLGTPTFTTKTNGGDPVELMVEAVPAPTVLKPAEMSQLATATPSFSGFTEPGSQVEVMVDEVSVCTSGTASPLGAWQCSGAAVPDGSHLGEAFTVDPLGNRSVATVFTFFTDTVAPAVPVIEVPAEGALLNVSPTLISGSAEPLAQVHVLMDADPLCTVAVDAQGAWSCAVTSSLVDGPHLASATAVDPVGNVSAATERAFLLDTRPPQTLIVSGPPLLEPAFTATFGLAADEEGARYECALDGADFIPCDDPVEFGGLTEATHLFRARAIDAAGNVDPSPAEYEWTVSVERGRVKDGCGCAGAGPESFAPLALLSLIAWARRRKTSRS